MGVLFQAGCLGTGRGDCSIPPTFRFDCVSKVHQAPSRCGAAESAKIVMDSISSTKATVAAVCRRESGKLLSRAGGSQQCPYLPSLSLSSHAAECPQGSSPAEASEGPTQRGKMARAPSTSVLQPPVSPPSDFPRRQTRRGGKAVASVPRAPISEQPRQRGEAKKPTSNLIARTKGRGKARSNSEEVGGDIDSRLKACIGAPGAAGS